MPQVDLGLARRFAALSEAIYPPDGEDNIGARFAALGFDLIKHCKCTGSESAVVTADGLMVVVFAGTSVSDRPSLLDIGMNFRFFPRRKPNGIIVHPGYEDGALKARGEFEGILAKAYFEQRKLYFTGHSMGGAMATLLAQFIKAEAVYSFGAPKPGNRAFWMYLLTPVYRIIHGHDLAPNLPPLLPWLSQGGEIWHTNGKRFQRLEVRLDPFILSPWGYIDHHPENYVKALASSVVD